MSALEDVAAERRRQVETEGWTPEHDDEHSQSEMALAAMAYISEATLHRSDFTKIPGCPGWWPWSLEWWKPGGKRRNLVKAGALIVAEIERLDRAQADTQEPDGGLVFGGVTEA